MSRKEKRFVMYTEGMGFGQIKILMDRCTGVHYLYYGDGSAGGLTPLLDSDGKPIIQPLSEDDADCDDE
ncbi:MAG: xylan 1,4-beta-xylosidase [Oscillospiraceae bacterium]|nr:xylan 1,4-beta-xylosidase [Oscillospiraceae bacterium]